MVPTSCLPIIEEEGAGHQEWGLGHRQLGDERIYGEGASGGDEDTAADATDAPLPSGLSKCCYLCLETSSIPLTSLVF